MWLLSHIQSSVVWVLSLAWELMLYTQSQEGKLQLQA